MQIYNDELCHYGKLGMRWGKRQTYGKIPRMITAKRQLHVDKKALEFLNNGGHTSVGLTKKRQEAYDKRDKKILENRITKNENRPAFKKEMRQMRKDQILHPVHSTVEQLKLIKNKPLKALNLDLQTAKELNDAVKKRIDTDKINRQKFISNGSKTLKNMFK